MRLGNRRIVAFDAGAVSAAVASWGLSGLRVSLQGSAPLVAGALQPGPLEPNLVRPEEVRAALNAVAQRIGPGRVTLVLPDGLERLALIAVPRGVEPREYARFRLGQGLPYSPADAIVDVLPVGGGRFAAAAVKRAVVEEYEAAASACGLAQQRIDLSPFAALTGLRRARSQSGKMVAVVLGDTAVTLAAFDGPDACALRNRRRSPGSGEAAWLCDEAVGTAAVAGQEGARFRVLGPGAAGLIRALTAQGFDAAPGWQAEGADAAELAFLGAAA